MVSGAAVAVVERIMGRRRPEVVWPAAVFRLWVSIEQSDRETIREGTILSQRLKVMD